MFITFLIWYFIGVILSIFMLSFVNDLCEHEYEKCEVAWAFMSWIVVIFSIYYIITISKIFKWKPSLKNLWKKKKQ